MLSAEARPPPDLKTSPEGTHAWLLPHSVGEDELHGPSQRSLGNGVPAGRPFSGHVMGGARTFGVFCESGHLSGHPWASGGGRLTCDSGLPT